MTWSLASCRGEAVLARELVEVHAVHARHARSFTDVALTAFEQRAEVGALERLIAAGRSGAAFAAEIGTMKVSEEVDALTTMGLDRTRFLVTPKVLSLLIMLPCLTLCADLVGILGGLTVSVAGLDLPAQVYIRQTRIAVSIWDLSSGLIKSVAFAILVAGIGCLRGFQARGGAESVGRITTSAIVAGIFLIIVTDAVFTVLFHYW